MPPAGLRPTSAPVSAWIWFACSKATAPCIRPQPPHPRPLPRFGNYQAEQLIGRGGMGAVYLATRDDGEVKLRVAVKSHLSSLLWSPLLEDRFPRRERQILAQLRHPHIAAFLDGGVTQNGLPFLVMEYVEGEPIDRFCDTRRLGVHERLALFLQVCDAVAFAHLPARRPP